MIVLGGRLRTHRFGGGFGLRFGEGFGLDFGLLDLVFEAWRGLANGGVHHEGVQRSLFGEVGLEVIGDFRLFRVGGIGEGSGHRGEAGRGERRRGRAFV